jgi:hypothetical protein
MAQVGPRRADVQERRRKNALLVWARSLRGLIGLVLLLVLLLGMISACGDEDLVFPGNIPILPTAASEPTDTPTPEEG